MVSGHLDSHIWGNTSLVHERLWSPYMHSTNLSNQGNYLHSNFIFGPLLLLIDRLLTVFSANKVEQLQDGIKIKYLGYFLELIHELLQQIFYFDYFLISLFFSPYKPGRLREFLLLLWNQRVKNFNQRRMKVKVINPMRKFDFLLSEKVQDLTWIWYLTPHWFKLIICKFDIWSG